MPVHLPHEINLEFVSSKLAEMVKINKIRPTIYSSLRNVDKFKSMDNLDNTSSFNGIIKLTAKNGRNLSFFKLNTNIYNNTMKVINKVIAPSFLSDANYNYLYSSLSDRKLAVYDRFNYLIPRLLASKCASSYILFDEDEYEPIGHILLYSPNSNDHEITSRKFSRQLFVVNNKCSTLIKMIYLSQAMHNEYKLINNLNKFVECGGFWEISCVSVDPLIQSVGYGTLIMNNIHNVIYQIHTNKPIILFTSTPDALRFYQRLGYKIFMEHNINHEIISYSLIYHQNELILKEWLNYLKQNIPYHHKVDRFSFMPSFITSKINKSQLSHNVNHLNYFFEY